MNPDAPESVHLCDFPVADEALIDEDLNAPDGRPAGAWSAWACACRSAANLKVRQPLCLPVCQGHRALTRPFRELAEDELNVKNVVFTDDARAFTTYNLKPQMRTLGPKYGKLLGGIGTALQGMDGNDVVDTFARGETLKFDVDGTPVELEKDDVLTEATQKPGFSAETDGSVTVVLDCNLTPELIVEGYQREVISKLQNHAQGRGLRRDRPYSGGLSGRRRAERRHRGGPRLHHEERSGRRTDLRRGSGWQGMRHQRQKGQAERSEGLNPDCPGQAAARPGPFV